MITKNIREHSLVNRGQSHKPSSRGDAASTSNMFDASSMKTCSPICGGVSSGHVIFLVFLFEKIQYYASSFLAGVSCPAIEKYNVLFQAWGFTHNERDFTDYCMMIMMIMKHSYIFLCGRCEQVFCAFRH